MLADQIVQQVQTIPLVEKNYLLTYMWSFKSFHQNGKTIFQDR
jgi:hypothetical protein